jgi:hypothetical protein
VRRFLITALVYAIVAVGAFAAVRVANPAPDPVPLYVEPASSIVANTRKVEITFYAAFDNDPKGSTTIDHPVLHKTAGGTGTYKDPLTFASPAGKGAYPYGTRIYVAIVKKYFIREDSCGVSWTATSGCGAVSHVDLYMGNPSTTKAVLKCESRLTPDGKSAIVVNPPDGLVVDPVPMWTQASGVCHASSKN